MAQLSQEPVDARVISDLYQYVTLYGSVDEFVGLPIIDLQATPMMGWNLVAKRLFDVAVAGLGWFWLHPFWTRLRLGFDSPATGRSSTAKNGWAWMAAVSTCSSSEPCGRKQRATART
jgi:hypothetical protein